MKKNTFDHHSELAAELAADIARRLNDAITVSGSASIAFSGGSTPKLLFAALAEQSIDWPAVQVTLVDERCVPADHERSNARLLHEFLLSKLPQQPVFLPLYEPGESSGERNARLQALAWPLDVAVLGMGGDGHTASFFPGAQNLDALLDPQQTEKLMDTHSVPDDEPRVTWSLAALLEARHLILHICGEDKAQVLQTALEQLETQSSADAPPYPIASLLQHTSQLDANGAPLDIYYSKNS